MCAEFQSNPITRIMFFKGQPIRDSTEKITHNKGQKNIFSTELQQNKGQWEKMGHFHNFVGEDK